METLTHTCTHARIHKTHADIHPHTKTNISFFLQTVKIIFYNF